MSPRDLDHALKTLPRQTIPEVLVGFENADDAGVYQLGDDLALVQTVDFFSPIVDDPFEFGQIAAANALSDIYAMGAKPLTALAVVGFPIKTADPEILRDIMAGGLDTLTESGVALMGGHSVRDDEVKFGYAITGIVNPKDVRKNENARVGERVILTKPLGTGLIATALKRGEASDEHVKVAVRTMAETNRRVAEIANRYPVGAVTDITGFGLLGHAVEVARASGLSIEFDHRRMPLLPGALDYSSRGFCAGGLKANREFFSCNVTWMSEVSEDYRNLLFDPQTSGGLLIFVPEASSADLLASLAAAGLAGFEVGFTREFETTFLHVN